MLRIHALYVSISFGLLVWREGSAHWILWMTTVGFVLLTLVCGEALARRARWAWWVLLILCGRRALIHAQAIVGASLYAEQGTAMEHLRFVGTVGVWLMFHVIIVGLLLHPESRAVFFARVRPPA